MWNRLRGLGLTLLLLTGCPSTEQNLRPAPQPEEYVIPPANDPRFSAAVAYPKGTLNKDLITADRDSSDSGQSKGPQRMGSMTPGSRY